MHKHWDRFETLAATASCAVCIFATPQGTDFALVGLDAAGDAGVMCDINARGLGFAGVIGLVDGAQRTELAEPLGDGVVDRMSALFVGYFVPRLLEAHSVTTPKAAPPEAQDDSESWLWRLWALKDPRMDS